MNFYIFTIISLWCAGDSVTEKVLDEDVTNYISIDINIKCHEKLIGWHFGPIHSSSPLQSKGFIPNRGLP